MPVLFGFNNSSQCLATLTVLPEPRVYSDAKYDFFWFVFVASYAHMAVAVALFLGFKRVYDRVRLRPLSFVAATCLAAIAQLNVGVLGPIMEPGYPCVFGLWDQIFIVPLACAGPMARLLVFIFLSRYSTLVSYRNPDQGNSMNTVGSGTGSVAASAGSRRLNLQGFFSILFHQLVKPREEEKQSEVDKRKLLFVLKFMVGPRGLPALTVVLVIPYVIIFFVYLVIRPEFRLGCTNCEGGGDYSLAIILILIAFFSILLTLYLNWLGREFNDKWGLRQESRIQMYWYLLALVGYILVIVDSSPLRAFDWQFVFALGMQGAVAQSTYVQVFMGWRDQAKKKKKTVQDGRRRPANETQEKSEVPTQGGGAGHQITIEQMLLVPALSDAFEQHLRSEYAVESLYFLRDVAAWKTRYFEVGVTARAARARKIAIMYIQTNGVFSINIDSKLQQNLLARVNSKVSDESIGVDIFDPAVHEIHLLLKRGTLDRFFHSAAFSAAMGSGALGAAGGGGTPGESSSKPKKKVNVSQAESMSALVAPLEA